VKARVIGKGNSSGLLSRNGLDPRGVSRVGLDGAVFPLVLFLDSDCGRYKAALAMWSKVWSSVEISSCHTISGSHHSRVVTVCFVIN
jgi:hypothetical protein